jgi:hypothetical protein
MDSDDHGKILKLRTPGYIAGLALPTNPPAFVVLIQLESAPEQPHVWQVKHQYVLIDFAQETDCRGLCSSCSPWQVVGLCHEPSVGRQPVAFEAFHPGRTWQSTRADSMNVSR